MFDFNKQFFERNQKLLLFIANRWYLSWLLGLNRLPKELKGKAFKKITPNSVHFDTGKTFTKRGKLRIERQGAFFTGPRFAEALAYNLTPFVYLQQAMSRKMAWRFSPVGLVSSLVLLFIPKISFIGFMGTVSDYYAGAGDGVCYREAVESWAAARSATSSTQVFVTDASSQFIQSWVSGGYNPIRRAFFPTDTSALPDTANISAADLKLYGTGSINNSDSVTGYLVETSQASTSTLVNDDYDNIGATSGGTFTYAGWNTAGYNTIALNATGLTWISKTGFTKIGARDGLDFNNTGPATGNNSLSCYFSEQTGTANDPYLSITYTVGQTISVSDTITLSESSTNLRARLISVSDTINLTESVSALKGLVISVSDTIGLTESLSALRAMIVSVSDTITMSENISVKKLWEYVSKSVASWTNGSKNSTNWSNESKNNSNWTNKSKS